MVRKQRRCCNVRPRKRVACEVGGRRQRVNLDKNPYLCRQVGCCYDGKRTNRRNGGAPRCYQTTRGCCYISIEAIQKMKTYERFVYWLSYSMIKNVYSVYYTANKIQVHFLQHKVNYNNPASLYTLEGW